MCSCRAGSSARVFSGRASSESTFRHLARFSRSSRIYLVSCLVLKAVVAVPHQTLPSPDSAFCASEASPSTLPTASATLFDFPSFSTSLHSRRRRAAVLLSGLFCCWSEVRFLEPSSRSSKTLTVKRRMFVNNSDSSLLLSNSQVRSFLVRRFFPVGPLR